MRKPSPRKIIKAAKAAQADRKVNLTFRVTKSILERFRAKCKSEDVTLTSVIEEFMREVGKL